MAKCKVKFEWKGWKLGDHPTLFINEEYIEESGLVEGCKRIAEEWLITPPCDWPKS